MSATTYIAPIDATDANGTDVCLYFYEDVSEDGARIVAWYNTDTGEAREQTLYNLPTGPQWRKTVAKRIARKPYADYVPHSLLKGIK